MKSVRLFLSLVVALFCATNLCGCQADGNEDEEARKVLSSKDYVITVASHKLEGVLTSCGMNVKGTVLAVKKEGSTTWEAWGGISDFDYEEGYEYRLKINETNYLDYRMGDPAWTEHKLLEVLLKEKKDTEGLPEDFVPSWYEKYIDN
ncbi:MAG: DUF4377 domain-containing protein [Prevotellaceae bacterium]|nr:DUF4377 domain-containing protein [Prevotellaceae bacterium]